MSPTTQQYERGTEDRNAGWAGARRGDCGRGGAGGGRPQTAPRCMSLHSGDFWHQVNVAHASKTKIVKSTKSLETNTSKMQYMN